MSICDNVSPGSFDVYNESENTGVMPSPRTAERINTKHLANPEFKQSNNRQDIRILAYTDSSTTERYACCSYIALNDTEETFLNSGVDFFHKVTSTQAELLSILTCVSYLADKYPGCKVSVFSDAQSIVEMWNNNSGRLDKINYAELFTDLLDKSKRFREFNLVHVAGHPDTATPNKLCDLISRRYRRLYGIMTAETTSAIQ